MILYNLVFEVICLKQKRKENEKVLEMIKKTLLAGLGATVVTKKMIEEATQSLVEQGKISSQEAEKLAEELVKSGEKQWDDIQQDLAESLRKGLDDLDISSKKEFQELKNRVENLEKRTTMLETAQAQAKAAAHGN